jgi:PAS domain S-box-containing protein
MKDLLNTMSSSEEKFKTLFELSPTGMALIDYSTGKFLEVNQSLLKIIGYTKEEFLTLSFQDITPKEYKKIQLRELRDLTYTGNFGPNEKEYIKKDGTIYPIRISGFSFIDENKKKVIWTLIEDITKKKEDEIIYKDNKYLLEYIAIETSLQNVLNKIVYLAEKRNPKAMCSILLLSKDKKHLLTGAAPSLPSFFSKAIHGVEIGPKVGSCGSAAFKKERVIVEDINTHENWKDYLELTKKANLHACWSQPIISSDNKVIGTFAIYYNHAKAPDNFMIELIKTYASIAAKAIEKNNYIQIIKKREKELEELNQLAQSLTKSQQALLSLFDKGDSTLFKWKNNHGWEIEYVSLSVSNLLGYKKEDFISNKVKYSSCIHPDDISKVINEVDNAIKEDLEYFKHEPYRIITKKNIEKWVLDYTIQQKDEEGKITHFIGYITDISEYIHSQEIMYHQSKIASLGEMIGNIAHQWRQPLSVISTTATGSILKKELDILDDEEFYKNMKSINEHAQYLSSTIDDFRDFSSLSNNKKEEMNLKNSIKKVFSLTKDSFKISNIHTIENLDDEIFLLYNENIFIQAMINIFNNAKDALNQINISDFEKYVFVTLKRNEKFYIIEIKDNANGIEEKYLNKIFDPYFTTKHQSQGTGIGLYMTNQILEKHLKASIEVENIQYEYLNKKYKGALFRIKIPINQVKS